MIFPRTSPHCKLVPVLHQEYENGIFRGLSLSFAEVRRTVFSKHEALIRPSILYRH